MRGKTSPKIRSNVIEWREEEASRATAEERMAAGKALREKVSRSSQAIWVPAANRPDPVEVLKSTEKGRLAELLPIRYGRMKESPFGFYRGAAAIMAEDLAGTDSTGIRVQACGDCHVSNFGGYASPERRLIFDINDFDETLPAPWEWDLKRLAASLVIARRQSGDRERDCRDAARIAARSYRKHMRMYAGKPVLEVWYSYLDAEIFIEEAKDKPEKKRWEKIEKKAKKQTPEHLFPHIAEYERGRWRIQEDPPGVYHPKNSESRRKFVREMFHRYRLTLPEERRVVLDRYYIEDIARMVVGVGSVGTRCGAILMLAGERDPFFLQIKEAHASVLEPYAGKSRYENHGQRVVTGQRMLQAASDVFLGWTRDDEGHDYYFRQLRDMKMKVDVVALPQDDWDEYIRICGWALARAHARTGDPARIAGYLGKKPTCDEAIAKFAAAYADQNEQDYEKFLKAIRAGKLPADANAAP
ncbi:MAG TPA: DUF2252 domain-containing protein [Candidatus Limnocylindrales bacterium]|nr:DUF2252 domain-containing protein [Candidatus Limnocylindrales bacterium]